MADVSLLIAGSRTLDPSIENIDIALSRFDEISGATIVEVVCGDAAGSDRAGARWAISKGIAVHHEPVTEADYAKHGKYAAPRMRNRRMAVRATAALLFWDGISGGTADMAIRMIVRAKPCFVVPMAKAKRKRSLPR